MLFTRRDAIRCLLQLQHAVTKFWGGWVLGEWCAVNMRGACNKTTHIYEATFNITVAHLTLFTI